MIIANGGDKTRAPEIADALNGIMEVVERRQSSDYPRNQLSDGTLSSAAHPFSNFGEQLKAVMDAGRPGGKTDERLYQVRAQGLGESVPSEGGFLVQQDFATELIGSLYEPGTLMSKLRKYGVSKHSNTMSMPGFDESSRADGLTKWVPAHGNDAVKSSLIRGTLRAAA